MNYQHHYNLLIERQKNRILEGYVERHHIVPRCLGGKDLPENLVDLTAREHYVQHQLLAKIYPENKGLQLAVSMMSVSNQIHERTENRRYQWVRERHQKQMSELQAGEGNSQFGTSWVHKGTKDKKVPKDSLKQWLDDGWEIGRYKAPKSKKECLCCGNKFVGNQSRKYCSKACGNAAKIGKVEGSINEIETSLIKLGSLRKQLEHNGLVGFGANQTNQKKLLIGRGWKFKQGKKPWK